MMMERNRSSNPTSWLLFLSIGFGYTVLSEWYNTNVSKAWEYTSSMPTLFGIGVTPLLQWLILPPIVALMIRRRLIQFQPASPDR